LVVFKGIVIAGITPRDPIRLLGQGRHSERAIVEGHPASRISIFRASMAAPVATGIFLVVLFGLA
jgi:hypothetical protein